MNKFIGVFATFGTIGMIFAVIFFCFLPLLLTIYGLYLAFSASILLGLIVLFVEPLPFILGLLAFLGHPEIAAKLAAWLHTVL